MSLDDDGRWLALGAAGAMSLLGAVGLGSALKTYAPKKGSALKTTLPKVEHSDWTIVLHLPENHPDPRIHSKIVGRLISDMPMKSMNAVGVRREQEPWFELKTPVKMSDLQIHIILHNLIQGPSKTWRHIEKAMSGLIRDGLITDWATDYWVSEEPNGGSALKTIIKQSKPGKVWMQYVIRLDTDSQAKPLSRVIERNLFDHLDSIEDLDPKVEPSQIRTYATRGTVYLEIRGHDDSEPELVNGIDMFLDKQSTFNVQSVEVFVNEEGYYPRKMGEPGRRISS